MNSLNQTYKELAIPYFKEIFDSVDEVMIQHRIPYYLIGVNAIALALLKEGVKPGRGTKDIDFAIMISSIDEYERLSTSLEEKGFKKVKAPWTFYSDKYNIAIDVLPFGEIEVRDMVRFKGRHADLHMLGFQEILEESVPVKIEEKIANVPPLPGMVILKLVAWSDRPEERTDDLSDILKIIEHYFDIEYDEIVELHYDTFPAKDYLDPLMVAAEVIGRKARNFLDKSEALSSRIYKILNVNLKKESESKIAREWAGKKDREIEYAYKLLEALQKGLFK